jgi:phosphoadenosine phosphosulfate reductase
MLGQMNLSGKDKIQTAIARFQTFEPDDGYHLSFSGGKDSIVIKALADMAGVKYDPVYRVTSADQPELVQFIKDFHPDVKRERPLNKDGKQYTMWNLIANNTMPPTRIVRYCCSRLKESGGAGRFTVTGIRTAESARRAASWSGISVSAKDGRYNGDPDNPTQELIHICETHSKRILNPIIDWTDGDVWEFIRNMKLPYCKLYDNGRRRLGCIGCPMNTHAKSELEYYPKYRDAYLSAFRRMLLNGKKEYIWKSSDEVMNWWIAGSK